MPTADSYPWLPLVAAAAVFAVVYTQTRPVVANDSPVHTMEDLKKAKGRSSKG